MSNLSQSEARKLSDLPGGMTEVYMDSMADGNSGGNDIEHFNLVDEFRYLGYEQTRSDKEWSQVFDLDDAVLICIVNEQKLEMRLVHLTDGPMIELRDQVLKQNDLGLGYSHLLNGPFVTEQDIMENLQKTSKRFEKARMSFDAPIVPNLCLIQNKNRQNARDNQQADLTIRQAQQQRRSPEQCQYTLALASQANRVYYVHFDRYYLEKRQTIFVESSDEFIFEHLKGQKIRCFEQIHDFVNNRDLFVIGSAKYVKPQSQLQNGQNRVDQNDNNLASTLTFKDSDGNVSIIQDPGCINPNPAANNQGQGGMDQQNNNASWLNRLTENLRGLRPGARPNQQNNQQVQPQNGIIGKFQQVVNDALVAPEQNLKNFEGVIAFKTLTNNLLAVIYTSGVFRVVEISTHLAILEINLLDDESRLGQDSNRITEAKIAFKTHDSVTDVDRCSFTKSISFGLVVAVENRRNSQKRFVLHTLSLRFNNVPAMDPTIEDETILGQDFDLDHTRQQIFEPSMIITSITACENSAFLYTTFEPQTKETSIFSTSCAQPIWDRGSQELKHQKADKTPISIEILKQAPQLVPALKKHYYERITAPNRFTPESLYTSLAEDRLFDANFSTKENLLRAIEYAPIDNINRFLQNLIELEARNGKILNIGEPLKCHPKWRILVRPLGICVLTETSYVSTVESAINLGSIEKEFYWSTSETELLIKFLGLLKTTLMDNLHIFSQRISESPQTIRQDAQKCIMNAKNETVVQKLRYMIETASGDIQDQLDKFFTKVIEKFILSQANKGKSSVAFGAQNGNYGNLEMDGHAVPQKLSCNSMKVIEQTIYQEIDALHQIMIDLYLGQILLQNSTQQLKEEQINKMENQICQITALKDALNADFVHEKVKQKLQNLISSNKRTEISRFGSVLQHLLILSKDKPEMAAFNLSDASQKDQDPADILIKVMKIYTQVDDLPDSPCHLPILAKHLCELDQDKTALTYLQTIRTKSIGVLFAQLYTMACQGEHLSDDNRKSFTTLTMSLISRTLILTDKAQNKIDLQQAFLMRRPDSSKQALCAQIDKLNKMKNNDMRLQYLILCAKELASREVISRGGVTAQNCAAFFITRCLAMERPNSFVTKQAAWSNDEKDYLFSTLFDSQTINVNLLYQAVTSMNQMDTRQAYLLKFFEFVRGANRSNHIKNAILTACPFGQPDITLFVEAIQNKIAELMRAGGESQTMTQNQRDEICNLTQVYHDVAQLYYWQDQFVKFIWSQWETSLSHHIKSVQNNVMYQTSKMRQVLSVTQFCMTLAYTASQSCGSDYYFHSSMSVQNSTNLATAFVSSPGLAREARKRSYNEAMNAGKMAVDESNKSQNQSVDTLWSKVEEIGNRASQFNRGKLFRVDQQRLLGVLMLCRAKLVCLDEMPSAATSNDPLHLSKVLVELGKADLAVELALANNASPAFAIASQLDNIKNLDIRDGEDEEEEAMREQRISELIERYLARVKPQHLGELAQYLIALRINFSDAMKSRLIEQKQVSYVIGCYLSPEISDVVRAVDFLMFGDDASDEQAAKILIHSDLNQVVNLLQMINESQKIFEKEQIRLERERESVKTILSQHGGQIHSKVLFRAESMTSMSGLANFQVALSDNRVISAILDDEENDQYMQWESSYENEKCLKKCIENIQALKKGSQKIQNVLKKELSNNNNQVPRRGLF